MSTSTPDTGVCPNCHGTGRGKGTSVGCSHCVGTGVVVLSAAPPVAVAPAIAAERERCAVVVENWKRDLVPGEHIENAIHRLADRIRQGID